MQIRVLGCSGGIDLGVATTSFLIDDDILIDAGTGVCELSVEQMQRIRHIFVTHSHLDHIAAIPLLADTLFGDLVNNPINVYASQPTVVALKNHIFNGVIWPDFTVLPRKDAPVLNLNILDAGACIDIDNRTVESIAVRHVVPGVGYRVESGGRSFAFSGDTARNDSFWAALNRHEHLDLLFIESAFANKDSKLAALAYHYCPQLLAEDLGRLKHRPTVGISHLKPGEEDLIMRECREALPGWELRQLKSGDKFAL